MRLDEWKEGAIAALGSLLMVTAIVGTVAFGIFVTSWAWYFLKQILPP